MTPLIRRSSRLYTDNGHFTDPSTITVTGAPEGFPFRYVGCGDYSGHYVSKLHIIYDRNEDGTPKLDENGQFVIKQLQKTNGTPLTYMGQPTTNIVGPFDQLTGTRPQHFLLMNEAGETVYAYCIDLGTGVASGNPFYSVANLEDANYYATSDAAEHIRAITQNGYWGTLEGMGSLTQLKSALKQAVADGKIEKEYDITFVIYIQNATANYELKEGEYIGNGKVCTTVTEHIILTDEVIDELPPARPSTLPRLPFGPTPTAPTTPWTAPTAISLAISPTPAPRTATAATARTTLPAPPEPRLCTTI